VLGLDVQASALNATRTRLMEAGLADRVLLTEARHEGLDRLLSSENPKARPRVVMFNLGYLPGGDHSIATRPESTIAAIEAALGRLIPGGLVTVVVYPGHPEGRTESERLLDWTRTSTKGRLGILRCDVPRTSQPAPWLLAMSPE
jgi:hypothetical protein